jgi:hypothetical protein
MCTFTSSVVFSSWTRMLDLIEEPIRKAGFTFRRIDGKGSFGEGLRRSKISTPTRAAPCYLPAWDPLGRGKLLLPTVENYYLHKAAA